MLDQRVESKVSLIDVDPEKQKKAKVYARLVYLLTAFELFISGIYCLAWLILGWAKALRDFLSLLISNEWLLVMCFTVVFGGMYYLIRLPIAFYGSFVLTHRFELSHQRIKDWVSDQIKGVLLTGVLGIIFIELLYAFIRYDPIRWWVWIGLIIIVFEIIFANLMPILIFPLFYKSKPLGEERRELIGRLTNLAEMSRTQVNGVYQFDMSRRTPAANAALMGLGNTRRIILSDTLISEFSDDEIETIFAHELGHHVHKDIPLALLVQSILIIGGLYFTDLGIKVGVDFFKFFNEMADVATMPLIFFAFGIYGSLVLPLSNVYSRWRETIADRYAIGLTGKPLAYASALMRLANQNLVEVDPAPWIEFLFYSHPALGKRIAMAQANVKNITSNSSDCL